MIAYIEGTVLRKQEQNIVIVVAGIGYMVSVPTGILESIEIGDRVELHTHQHIREDALDLYGFETQDELGVFQQLIQVSGIGPRMGLGLLSAYAASEIQRAIVEGDTALLSSVSGIGKKTAERLVLDLKDSMAILPSQGTSSSVSTNGSSPTAVEALVSLGYTHAEAVAALRDIDSSLPIEEQIKLALKQ